MKQAHNTGERGFTLVELLAVLLMLAIIVISVPQAFKAGTQVWEKGDRHAEVMQNALIGMEQMTRELRQAKYVTSVSSPDSTGGYIEFKYKDGSDGKYQLYEAKDSYLQHDWSNDKDEALSGIKSAGPVDSVTFDCYKYMNSSLTPINLTLTGDDLEKEMRRIRLVKIQMSTYDDQGKTSPIPLSSWVYLRGWSTGRIYDYAIFGNDGVDIGDQNTIVGDTNPSNIGANGDIIVGNKLDFRSGETHHGGGGELLIDPPGNTTLGDNNDYGPDEIILLPCITDFSSYSSGTITPLDPVENGGSLDLPPGSYDTLDLGNDATIDLYSGVYYFQSIEADNNISMNIHVTDGDLWVFVEGRAVIGNTLSDYITMDPVEGGGAENVYFETHYGDPDHDPPDDPDVPAWSMGGNALWSGTIYAPYGDIDVTDGLIEGQLLSGGTVTVHGGDPGPVSGPEAGYTYIDFVLSNYIRDYGYACYDEW